MGRDFPSVPAVLCSKVVHQTRFAGPVRAKNEQHLTGFELELASPAVLGQIGEIESHKPSNIECAYPLIGRRLAI